MDDKEYNKVFDDLYNMNDFQFKVLWKELNSLNELAAKTTDLNDHLQLTKAMCIIAETIVRTNLLLR